MTQHWDAQHLCRVLHLQSVKEKNIPPQTRVLFQGPHREILVHTLHKAAQIENHSLALVALRHWLHTQAQVPLSPADIEQLWPHWSRLISHVASLQPPETTSPDEPAQIGSGDHLDTLQPTTPKQLLLSNEQESPTPAALEDETNTEIKRESNTCLSSQELKAAMLTLFDITPLSFCLTTEEMEALLARSIQTPTIAQLNLSTLGKDIADYDVPAVIIDAYFLELQRYEFSRPIRFHSDM